MSFNLQDRSFLTLRDFTPAEIKFLLKLSADLKTAKYSGTEQQRLKGKCIALIFEKASTRTRVGFEVAAYDQGAHVTYLGPSGTQIGHKETMKDTARVLGRIYDAIEYRGFSQKTVEELAKYLRRAGLQRPYRRVPSNPSPCRSSHHAGAQREAVEPGELLFSRRCRQQHGRFTSDRRRQDGNGCAALRAEGAAGRTRKSSPTRKRPRRKPGRV